MLEAPKWAKIRLGIALLVGALGLAYFLIRGPLRAFQPGGNHDFYIVHNALQTFNAGNNPYVKKDMLEQAIDRPLEHFLWHFSNSTLLYAPGFLLVFYPLGLIPAESAAVPWIILELVAFLALLHYAAQLVELEGTQRRWLLVAGLFFAPVHTSISHGQPGIIFCVLTVFLFCCLKQRRDGASAIALGLLMIKPSFGAPAAWVALVRNGWRVPALATVVTLITWLPFLSRYGVVDGSQHYLTAIADVQQPGGDADDGRENRLRFDLINLRSWLHSWSAPRFITEGLNVALLTLLGYALYHFRRRVGRDPDSSFYWTLAVVFPCLAVYHRFYDATILLVAVAAVIKLWADDRRASIALGAMLLPFGFPGTAYLHYTLGSFAESLPWFEALVVRHQTPAILLAGLLVVFLMNGIL